MTDGFSGARAPPPLNPDLTDPYATLSGQRHLSAQPLISQWAETKEGRTAFDPRVEFAGSSLDSNNGHGRDFTNPYP